METTITSVNPALIVLEVSLSSVLSVYTSVTICAYPQTNYISVTFFTDHPYWSLRFPGLSLNFRRRPYSLQTPSWNIRRNFLSHYWCGWVKYVPDPEIYGCCKDNMDDLQITYRLVADINYTWHPQTFYRKFKQFDFLWCPHGHFTSVADATRTLWMVWTCSRMKYMIRKSLTIFHIW